MEQLIEELVDPTSHRTPKRIEEVQKEIQGLQRETTGWHLGLALLKNSSSQLRFYGALTLTIKIRTDWAFLETENGLRDAVLAELITSYVNFTNELEQQFVLRKVSSTLAAFLPHSNSYWQFPVRHVLTSLCAGQIVQHTEIDDFQQTWTSIQHISAPQLRSVLWLCSSLVEEATRQDLKGIESADLAERVVKNAPDVWYLIYLTLRCFHLRKGHFLDSEASFLPNYLSPISDLELLELSKEALDTASTWMCFHSSSHSDHESISDVVDATMIFIMRCFSIPELADNTIMSLTGISQQAPKYLMKAGQETLNTLLTSQQAGLYTVQLQQGGFEAEAIRFVVFVASLLDLHDLSSPESFEDETLRIVLAILRSLLYTPGTAVVVDEVCQTVLDAFNQIADGWGDWVGSNAADQSMKSFINEACMQYSVKIQYPPQDSDNASDSWDSYERVQFQDFRHDVEDLLLASYACMGPGLVQNLAAPLRSSDHSSGWEDFEAHLYCLGALSDAICNNTAELGRHVLGVLTSQKWHLLMNNVNTIPNVARQGAIQFISRNAFILQRNKQHLLPCINFLFASLHLPGSITPASRAISTLCHKQRSMLVEALPQFINSLSGLANIPSDDRHRLFGAVAAIIQATPTEDSKVASLVRMFALTSQYSEAAFGGSAEEALVSAVDLLQSLAAVGKGLRAPAEESINLDAEPSTEEQIFWIEGDGKHVQQNVRNVIDQVLANIPDEPLLIEATCDILKSGYTEAHPSPFKFDAGYSASFLAHNIDLGSSRIGLVIGTASSFLASHVSNPDAIRREFFHVSSAMTACQRAILDCYAETKIYDDHEFTHSSLDYFARMLPKYGYYFSEKSLAEAWQILFEFALLALENPDTLPRRSAAQFWAAIFENSPSLRPGASGNLAECIQHYGPRFTATLLSLLGGGAARSELDVLCEPLKKLVARQRVLGASLLREAVARAAEGDERTRRFVEQVIGLRGGRKTGDVVKEFWVGSRGAAFAYAG